jgi:hypothetical protein
MYPIPGLHQKKLRYRKSFNHSVPPVDQTAGTDFTVVMHKKALYHCHCRIQDIPGEISIRFTFDSLKEIVGGTFTYSAMSDLQARPVPSTLQPLS